MGNTIAEYISLRTNQICVIGYSATKENFERLLAGEIIQANFRKGDKELSVYLEAQLNPSSQKKIAESEQRLIEESNTPSIVSNTQLPDTPLPLGSAPANVSSTENPSKKDQYSIVKTPLTSVLGKRDSATIEEGDDQKDLAKKQKVDEEKNQSFFSNWSCNME